MVFVNTGKWAGPAPLQMMVCGSREGGPMLPLLLLYSRLAARSCVIRRFCATWSPAGDLSPGGEFVPSRTQMDPAPFNRSFITAAPGGGAGRGVVVVQRWGASWASYLI